MTASDMHGKHCVALQADFSYTASAGGDITFSTSNTSSGKRVATAARKPPPALAASTPPPEIEHQVREFYAQYNPAKLPEVPALLAKYRGRIVRAAAVYAVRPTSSRPQV